MYLNSFSMTEENKIPEKWSHPAKDYFTPQLLLRITTRFTLFTFSSIGNYALTVPIMIYKQ